MTHEAELRGAGSVRELVAVEFQGSFSRRENVALGDVDIDPATGRASFLCGNQRVSGRLQDLDRPQYVFRKRDVDGVHALVLYARITKQLRFDDEPNIVSSLE